jgi:hypothetical protein
LCKVVFMPNKPNSGTNMRRIFLLFLMSAFAVGFRCRLSLSAQRWRKAHAKAEH